MENRCIIISGGVFGPVPEKQPGDFIIACDRGYVYCERSDAGSVYWRF